MYFAGGIVGRNKSKGEAAIKLLDQWSENISFFPTDVAVVIQCHKAIQSAVDQFGKLDIVINCAGVFKANPIEEVTEEEFDWIVDTNLKGSFFICKYAVPVLLKNNGGTIINVSLNAGLQGNKLSTAYCASKGGLTIFSKALAVDLAPNGIRVNCICQGDIETPMLDLDLKSRRNPDEYLDTLTGAYPVGRLGRPEEVHLFLFLGI